MTGAGQLASLSNEQPLKMDDQICQFPGGKILVTKTVAVAHRPQFQVFNPVVRLDAVLMMNRFLSKQIPSQMCLHNQPVLLDISVLCRRMIRRVDHNITLGCLSASSFPVGVRTTLSLSREAWARDFAGTGPTTTSQHSLSRGTTDFPYRNPLGRITLQARTFNGHKSLVISRRILHTLGRVIKCSPKQLGYLLGIKWTSVVRESMHCRIDIPNELGVVKCFGGDYVWS